MDKNTSLAVKSSVVCHTMSVDRTPSPSKGQADTFTQQQVPDKRLSCPLTILRLSQTVSQTISARYIWESKGGYCRDKRKTSSPSCAVNVAHVSPAPVEVTRPAITRTFSDSCIIPSAPRMSSSEPNPLFLESLPHLTLPPPSVDDGDARSIGGDRYNDRRALSSSMRERTGTLAGGFKLFASPSSSLTVGVGAAGLQAESTQGSQAHTSFLEGLTEESPTSRSSMVLSILANKTGAGSVAKKDGLCAPSVQHTGHSAPLPAMQGRTLVEVAHTTIKGPVAEANIGDAFAKGVMEGPIVCHGVTPSTAATTASSVSILDGLKEVEDVFSTISPARSIASSLSGSQASQNMEEGEEDASEPPSADADVGPFELEELHFGAEN